MVWWRFALPVWLFSGVGILAAPMALPPLDMAPAEDLAPDIQWSDGWQQSLADNVKRWETELKTEPDRDVRERRLAARRIGLLRASLKEFPSSEAGDAGRRFQIARYLGAIGGHIHRVRELRAIIDEHPGNLAAATTALRGILDTAHNAGDDLPRYVHWIEYVTRHLSALAKAGHLSSSDPSVVAAYLDLSQLRRQQTRYAQAAHALQQAEVHGGRTAAWLMQSSRLAMDMGLTQIARDRLNELLARDGDSASIRRSHQDLDRKLRGIQLPGPMPTVRLDPALESRWQVLRQQADNLNAAAALLNDPRVIDAVTPVGGARYTSLWSALVQWLSASPTTPAAIEASRRVEAEAAAAAGMTDEQLLAAHRRFPWSPSIHEVMLAAGERALWRGQPGIAYCWFDDVAQRGMSEETRKQAMVGCWLALSQSGDRPALEAALASISDDDRYPWMGGTVNGGRLRDQLLMAAGASADPAAGSLRSRRVLALPAVEAWAPVAAGADTYERAAASQAAPRPMVAFDGWSFVAGPTFVAGYAPGSDQPTWTRVQPVLSSVPDDWDIDQVIAPAAQQPTLADDILITRGAPDPHTGTPTAVFAYAAASGVRLWSTRDDPAWQGLTPVSDVTVADGIGYVIAMDEGLLATPYVIAFDPRTGSTRWKRALASQSLSLTMSKKRRDVTHYGNSPAIVRGAVYVSTNLGMVARLDARDGSVDWLYLYPRTSNDERTGLPLIHRLGASPIVVDGRVLLLPRDRQGLFALDAATGMPAWERSMAPSIGAAVNTTKAATATGAAIVWADHVVAAIDPRTGDTRWRRSFDQPLRGTPQCAGDFLYLFTGDELFRLDAATGADLARQPWSHPRPTDFAIAPDAIVGVTIEPQGSVQPIGRDLVTTDDVTHLRRESPRVVGSADDVTFIRSGDLLEAVQRGDEVSILWRRRLPTDVPMDDSLLAWLPDRLIVACDRAVEAISLRDGHTLWRRTFDEPITRLAADEVGIAVAPEAGWVALIDPASGELKWQRLLAVWARSLRVEALSFHDGLLHVLGFRARERAYAPCRVTFDSAGGEVLASEQFLILEGKRPRLWDAGLTDGRAWLLGRSGLVRTATLGVDQVGPSLNVKLSGFTSRGPTVSQSPDGSWLHIRQRNGRALESWLVPTSDPTAVVRAKTWFIGFADGLAVQLDETAALIHRPGATPVKLDIPQKPYKANPIAAAAGPEGKHLAVASRVVVRVEHIYRPIHLRIDIFDARSGKRLAGAMLPKIPVLGDERQTRETWPTAMDIAWHGDTLIVTGPHAAHLLPVPQSRDASEPSPPAIPHCDEPVTIDARLGEWDDALTLTLTGPDGTATARLMYGQERLYIAVSQPQPSPAPLVGGELTAGGAWLEVGTATHGRSTQRFGVGLDAVGRRTRWISLDDKTVPSDANAAIRYDAATSQLHYELSIPLGAVTRRAGHGWRPMGLSLAAWGDNAGPSTPTRYTWGHGLEEPQITVSALRLVDFEPRQ